MAASKKKKKKTGNTIVLLFALAVMAVALWKLIPIILDYKQSEDTYQELVDAFVEVEVGVDETEETEEMLSDDWKYINIDFTSLKAINSDVVAWIRFDNTGTICVNYPVLQGASNDTYLHLNLYGETYSAGSIFLESENSRDFSDCYNIIYGHNMKNGSMFGTLKLYKRNDNIYGSNKYFTIYTPTGAYRYQIFAYEDVTYDSVIYTVGYAADDAYQSLINRMLSGTMRDTGVVPTIYDKIVTLSTCTSTGDDYRFVIHAVCIDEITY